MDLKIRPARAEDLDLLISATGEGFGLSHRTYLEKPEAEGTYLTAWIAETPVAHLWIRWLGSNEIPRIVDQYPQLAEYAGYPVICDVFVAEEDRSQGIGTHLLRHAMQLARDRGATHAIVGAYTDNPGARRLYERIGFAEIGIGIFTTSGTLVNEDGVEREWQNGPQVMLMAKL